LEFFNREEILIYHQLRTAHSLQIYTAGRMIDYWKTDNMRYVTKYEAKAPVYLHKYSVLECRRQI